MGLETKLPRQDRKNDGIEDAMEERVGVDSLLGTHREEAAAGVHLDPLDQETGGSGSVGRSGPWEEEDRVDGILDRSVVDTQTSEDSLPKKDVLVADVTCLRLLPRLQIHEWDHHQ
jgi:hypothetical protein